MKEWPDIFNVIYITPINDEKAENVSSKSIRVTALGIIVYLENIFEVLIINSEFRRVSIIFM